MQNFEQKLDAALKANMIKEDTRPSEGMWYFVWLKPRWELRVFKETEYGNLTHQDAWYKYLAPIIGKHYKVDINKVVGTDSLKNAYACMPRGRVYVSEDGKYTFGNGDDFPINPKKAQIMLISQFELTKLALMGKTKWKYDEHERMIETDQAVVQALIGKVPYGKASPAPATSQTFDDE